MSVSLVELDPLADPRWAELVARAPAAVVFHHPGWLRLLHTQYGHPFVACCVCGPDGRLVAGLPVADVRTLLGGRRLVAVPFSDLCPPLLAAGAPPAAAPALAAALEALRRRRGVALEVYGTGAVLADAAPGPRFHHHVLALEPDVGAVVRGFRKSMVARGVRRAVREGLTAERRTDEAALAAFYRLHMSTRARLGVATQPRSFILRFRDLFAAGLGFVMLVRDGRRPVAAAVFLTHRGVLTYKYGASDAGALRRRPNNLLFMEAIRWGCENEMRALDFGRTDWDHRSLRDFKLAWGPEEHELRYRRLGDRARRRAPAAVNHALAPLVRRSPLASRLAGEVLYRHAG